MYKLILVFIFILLTGLLNNISAQAYPFTNITVENGLSQSQVLCAFQDDDGVMWFGTNGSGITKYDGHSFEYITDKDKLADNVVFCIEKNKDGKILIGTNGGLSVYNPKLPKAQRFRNFTVKDGLSHDRVFTILFDHQGRTLLGTGQGVSLFQDSTCKLLKINLEINNAPVFHLMEDSKHQLWLGTMGQGVFVDDNKAIKHYTTKDGLQNDMIFSILEYQPNIYWFFTGEGLSELKNKKLHHINPVGIDSTTTYYSYLKDKQKNIWLATSGGIIKYKNNNKYDIFTTKQGLVNNSIWKLCQDRENNLWFTSNVNGISKLNSERFLTYTTKDGLLDDEIKDIYQSKDGNYWIASNFGISAFDGHTFHNYTTKDFSKGNAVIWSIIEDKSGNYLIGTQNGLLIHDGNNFKRITCKDPKSNLNVIFDIFIDRKGEIWLGTQAGVAKVNNCYIESDKKFKDIKSFVYKISQDSAGNYWFGSDDGLYEFNGNKLRHFNEKDGISQKPIRDIATKKDGSLWFATNIGIYKYFHNELTYISKRIESNSIVFDDKNNIWIGSPKNNLYKLTEKSNDYIIKQYSSADGFIGDCNPNTIVVDNANKLWIGTSKGLVVYQPEYDRDNTLEPKTKIKRIDLFNQETDWNLFADSVDANNIPLNLELPYNKNYLKFMFVGVSLTTPSKVSYLYMLKGRDTSWTPTTKTEIAFDNMPPGDYEFLVKAQNGEGVWNKEPVSFKFTITPPFWKTWWFYSIVALIVLMGIYSYIKIRTANFKILKQNEIIEEKNAALQYANEEIAEKNQSITDSINYAKRIQQSFLSSEKMISEALTDHFILYKPRDIVSGDFYWAFDLPDRTLIACSDCTGHGIPGAFMSLIGISLLNEISHSKGIIEPAKILDELRRIIICALNPEAIEAGGKDGMDISLISIFKSDHPDTIKIRFAGANSSLYIVSENSGTTKMLEFKGDKQPVGFYSMMTPFIEKEITAKKGDTLYLYTDGYADQFGGVNGKKFMSKQLKQQLSSISHLPLKEQELYLEKTLQDWQGNLEQVDDVTVIGIKL